MMKFKHFFCFLLVSSGSTAFCWIVSENKKVAEHKPQEIAVLRKEATLPKQVVGNVVEHKEHAPSTVTVKKPAQYVKYKEMKTIVTQLSSVVTALASMKKEQGKRDDTFNKLVETKIADAVDAIKHSFDTKFAKLKKEIAEKMTSGEKRVKSLVNNLDEKVIKHEVAQQLASVRTEYGDFIKNREKRQKLRILLSDAIDSGRL
jgi:hypothetical protein